LTEQNIPLLSSETMIQTQPKWGWLFIF
jgi:hypothetical protein